MKKVLAGMLIFVAAGLVLVLPSLRRYVKMERM
jgi:uncharacterized protein DUF6893